jgi:endogenous inhibitor of DNA gyrase (YacG/DUF329 family)
MDFSKLCMRNGLIRFDEDKQLPDTFEVDGDEVFKVSEPKKCCICGTITHYVSVSFAAFYCSKECLEIDWQEYEEAEHICKVRDSAIVAGGSGWLNDICRG